MKNFLRKTMEIYIKVIELLTFAVTITLSPVYLLLMNNPMFIPDWLLFIKPSVSGCFSLFAQFLILEFITAALELVGKNTTALFAIIGAFLLSEYSLSAGWFIPEVILITSAVAIFSFSQSDYKRRVAAKFVRILLLVFAQIFNVIWL